MLRAVSPPNGGASRYWGMINLSMDQTAGIVVGSPVRLDTATNGDIVVSGYRVLLPVAGGYACEGVCRIQGTSASAGHLVYGWYDVTHGGFVGTYGNINAQGISSAQSNQPLAVATVTVSVPTELELRITAATSVSRIYVNSSFARITGIA